MFEERGGEVTVRLSARERAFIAGLPALLDTATSPDDPGHAVLHRAGYTDAAKAVEFEEFVETERTRMRDADRAVASRIGEGADVLSPDEARSLMRCVNEARLVLAARSGLFDEGPGWESRIETDPNVAAVAWLGYLQSMLIESLPERS